MHAIVATGKSDWLRDVEDEKGSVMMALGKEAKGSGCQVYTLLPTLTGAFCYMKTCLITSHRNS